MNRDEFFRALRVVIPITLATMAVAYVIMTGMMMTVIGFQDAPTHYTLTTIFPLILTPAAVFPLAVISHRLRLVKQELETLLRLDALTGLPNRRAFFEQAKESFARESSVSLMMVDVDHFKSVNDTYGHDIGDRVLRVVAQSIQSVIEQMPGDGANFVARIGGEEFAVVIEGSEGEAAGAIATELIERMRHAPAVCGGRSIPVTLSIGLAHRRPGDTPDVVLRAADNACYRAKRLGRDQWCPADAVADRQPLEPDGALHLKLSRA